MGIDKFEPSIKSEMESESGLEALSAFELSKCFAKFQSEIVSGQIESKINSVVSGVESFGTLTDIEKTEFVELTTYMIKAELAHKFFRENISDDNGIVDSDKFVFHEYAHNMSSASINTLFDFLGARTALFFRGGETLQEYDETISHVKGKREKVWKECSAKIGEALKISLPYSQ